MNRITDRCKNITFSQLLLQTVIIGINQYILNGKIDKIVKSSFRIQKGVFNLMSVPMSGPVKSAMTRPGMFVRIHLGRNHLTMIVKYKFPLGTLHEGMRVVL